MTLNGAIMQLVEMRENSMMPMVFKPYFDKVIETVSECEEPSPNSSESPNGWIPCTPETMPRGSQIVLLTLPEHIDDYGQEFCSSIICGHYIGGKDCEWGISDGSMIGYGLVSARYGVSPIAYMPLPAPYQSKEDEL